MKTTHSKDQQVNQLIDRKKIKPHPHNKMWGKGGNSHKSLGLTISVTGDIEPIRVCKTAESDSDYLILSGHSRFELSSEPMIECKDLGMLTEEEQVLRLIAYNAGHATDRGKLLLATKYCREHFPKISIDSILDAAGVVEDRDGWKESICLAVEAIEAADKSNKARTTKSMVNAASEGTEPLKKSASNSLSKSGMKVASEQNSSVTRIADNSLPAANLTAKNTPVVTDEFTSKDPAQEASVATTATHPASSLEVLRKKLMAEYKALVRKYPGTIPNGPAQDASSFLISFLDGKVSEHPAQLSASILESKLSEEKDAHRSSIEAADNAVDMINGVFAKWLKNTKDGETYVPAHAISYALIENGFSKTKDMNPEVLAANGEGR